MRLLRVWQCIARSEQEEKEFFMVISMKKAFVVVILALLLLAVLFSWTAARVGATPSASVRSSHAIAWMCPPPPRYC